MLGAIIGLVGAIIAVVVAYKLGERSERNKEKRRGHEEDLELQLYAELVQRTKDGSVFEPSPESDVFKLAIRLQQKGLIERLPIPGHNYFTLPNAPIKLDTSEKVRR